MGSITEDLILKLEARVRELQQHQIAADRLYGLVSDYRLSCHPRNPARAREAARRHLFIAFEDYWKATGYADRHQERREPETAWTVMGLFSERREVDITQEVMGEWGDGRLRDEDMDALLQGPRSRLIERDDWLDCGFWMKGRKES